MREINERYEFRNIRPGEGEQAAAIERACFPPKEACTEKMMLERAAKAPELFLVAMDRRTGEMAGFLTGISTNEGSFRDAFFLNADLHDPAGENVMILSLAVLPNRRRQGLARELMSQFLAGERRRKRRRVLLTCVQGKVKMYEKMGFHDDGIANSSWGGNQWREMSCMASE